MFLRHSPKQRRGTRVRGTGLNTDGNMAFMITRALPVESHLRRPVVLCYVNIENSP